VAVELWLGLGLAVAKILLRAADKSDAADALDDAHGGWSILRAVGREETALGTAIAEELERHLGGTSGAVEGDLRAAAQDVADLLGRLAVDRDAVVAAVTNPDDFLAYAKEHGGNEKRRLMSERAALAFDRILGIAGAEFARLAPSSSRFLPSGLIEILRQLPVTADHAQQAAQHSQRAANGVDQLLKRGDRNVVGAARGATEAGKVVGQLVPDWAPAELGVRATIVVDGVGRPNPVCAPRP
jgi:NACHT N-terminal Helical domain 1